MPSVSSPRERALPLTWTVDQFKAFERAEVDLTRLTLVAGGNSSGKSTLLQSLLFAAQSVDENRPVLNGPLVRLGTASDALHGSARQMSVELAYTTRQDRGSTAKVSLRIALAPAPADGEMRVAAVNLERDGSTVLRAETAKSSSLEAVPEHVRSPRVRSASDTSQLLHVKELINGAQPRQVFLVVNGVLPSALLVGQRSDAARAALSAALEKAGVREGEVPTDTDALHNALMDAALGELEYRQSPQLVRCLERLAETGADGFDLRGNLDELAEDTRWRLQPLRYRPRLRSASIAGVSREMLDEPLRLVAMASEHFERQIAGVQYLGPLRDEPRMVSPVGSGTRHLRVGVRGEFTASLLAQRGGRPISYRSPDGSEGTKPLRDAVSEWTAHIGVADLVKVAGRGKLGHTLQVVVDGVERDLTAVGVGASQVVPAVVAVLAANRGDTLLLEQPELHLHPAMQARLADLLALSRPDIRLLVETHSEHLVRRLRLHIAAGRFPPAKCEIVFAARNAGVASLRRVAVGHRGDIEDWPAGFFDTAESETIALLRAAHGGGR